MPFMNINANSAKEPTAVEPGDYTLEVAKAEVVDRKQSDTNPGGVGQNLVVTFDILDADNPRQIQRYFPLPHPDFGEEKCNSYLVQLKRMLLALGLDGGPFDTDSLAGLKCSAILSMSEYQGEPRNEIKKFLVKH
jgi:hypothetical protein